VAFVPHHIAHAASAAYPGSLDSHQALDPCSILLLDGRGEATSHLAARRDGPRLIRLAGQRLPHSLGLDYEELTGHLGFLRSSDEYKVMALASYGTPRMLGELRRHVYATGDGGFHATKVPWEEFTSRRRPCEAWSQGHADLAASTQKVLEEVLLDLVRWLHGRTRDRELAMAGGVALNCVANSRIARDGPFDHVWVQPAAGDAGTALGAALHLAAGASSAPRSAPLAPAATSADRFRVSFRVSSGSGGGSVRRPRHQAAGPIRDRSGTGQRDSGRSRAPVLGVRRNREVAVDTIVSYRHILACCPPPVGLIRNHFAPGNREYCGREPGGFLMACGDDGPE
jgi:hypothetical protein